MQIDIDKITVDLAADKYWPAMARKSLNEKKYSRAIELCQEGLKEHPDIVSARIILAKSLYHSGQFDDAEKEFFIVISQDSKNLAALKYLGDLKFRQGDEAVAFSYYNRIQRINPNAGGIACHFETGRINETKVLTLVRNGEALESSNRRLRDIPFKTETAGDLLLSQGHTRLAIEVYKDLVRRTGNPTIIEKLNQSRHMFKKKEKKNGQRAY
jgi:tetratricopeptide (TPR) repeat protein